VYELPPGFCTVFEAWLKPKNDSAVLYHGEVPDGVEVNSASARIAAGETAAIKAGGPLASSISTQSGRFSREIFLKYGDSADAGGLIYQAVVASGANAGFSNASQGPPYEVHTADGRLIASGNFDYG
jgi:hypothetical protein